MKAQKKKLKELFAKFIDIFRKFHANIPLPEATSQMPIHAKFLNEVLLKKWKLNEFKNITLNADYNDILQHKLPPKLKDPRSLKITCSIRNSYIFNVLYDPGASINLMHLSVYKKLDLEKQNDTRLINQTIPHEWLRTCY